MISKIQFSFCLVFFFINSIHGQYGFKKDLALDPNEPNTTYQVIEKNDNFYISGQYFDSEIGRWTAFASIYDLDGNFLKKLTEKNDTIPILSFTNHTLSDELGIYNLGNFNSKTKIFHYNFDNDSVWISHTIDQIQYDFSPHGFTFNRNKDKILICGRNYINSNIDLDIALLSIQNDAVQSFHDVHNPDRFNSAHNILLNSKGNIIVQCRESIPGEYEKDLMYFMFIDEDLNVLSSTLGTGQETNISLDQGMCIDQFDNILCTGIELDKISEDLTINYPTISRFDSSGNHIWTKRIGNNTNNIDGWGRWKNVIESQEKDGYIIVGSESSQNDDIADTLIATASIAKISYDGDSIWKKTFSYRHSHRIVEQFNDVIATSDEGYLAVGQSLYFDATDNDLPWARSILLKINKDGELDTAGVSTSFLIEHPSLKIFPNPTNGILYIKQSEDKLMNIEIFNVKGEIIKQYKSFNNGHTILFETNNLYSGMYFIKGTDSLGHIYTSRFIVE